MAEAQIHAGARVYLAQPPAGFDDALEALAPLPDGVTFLRRPGKDVDVDRAGRHPAGRVGAPVPGAHACARTCRPALGRLAEEGGREINGDVDFAAVQELGLAAGLVDNKSASITEDFQGVQFVVRLTDRARGR